ncbi:helix-turn-helix transcriptional regulator [Psychrobacter maritimus]|uniref:helix-turn-helix transcriptional regulator n=1 Tax=Psychrobacter maritimus TaxID=256325 RepID=UPI003FD50174
MEDKKFTVHKSMVLSNRKALALYLFKINRADDIPKIMALSVDLNTFIGDRVPLEIVTREIDLAVQLLQEEYIGLKIMELTDVKALPLYKGIKLCINPLLKAEIEIPFIVLCRLVSRYFKVITESIQVTLVIEKSLLRLDFNPSMPKLANNHQIDGVILAVHKILAEFSALQPVRLTIAHRNSTHGSELYKKLLGIPAELASKKNSLYYPLMKNYSSQSNLNLSAGADISIESSFFIGPLHYMLDKEFPDLSYAERCQHILMTIIGLSEATRETVAQVLNMSVSSLQRRLREEETSFQKVLLHTKKVMADKFLVEQNLSATDVSFLLGYQSHSQFFQAFKRWYSMTPMAYQKLHRSHSRSDY